MKNFKEMDELYFSFGEDNNRFTDNYSGRMVPGIRAQLQELMFTGFVKEIDAISECEKVDIRYKKKFYNKLLRAKRKLVKLDRADAWFDKVFQKYFNRGILEHLIVYAIMFLYKKDLFVPKRLFKQINNDELLAAFTAAACDYLGWISQNEPIEQPTADETETTDEQQETDKTQAEDKEAATTEETTPPEEQKPADDVSAEPKCCRECGAFIDDDDGCYCNKYGKYLNGSDVDSICCCESGDFFDDEEDDPE